MGWMEDAAAQVIKDAARPVGSSNPEANRAVAERFQEYPGIAAILCGVMDGKTIMLHPATLMLFVEAGDLKFTINNKKQGRVGFGTVPKDGCPWEGLDLALREGKVDYRAPRDRK